MSMDYIIDMYLPIIGSTFLVYLIIIILIRFFGQKQISDMNLQDFVMVLLIAETTQHAMVKDDSTVLGAFLSVLTIFVTNKLINIVFYRYPALRRKVEAPPVMIVVKGRMIQENMKKIQLNPDELQEILRENGNLSLNEVKYGIMENDGKFSIIENEKSGGEGTLNSDTNESGAK